MKIFALGLLAALATVTPSVLASTFYGTTATCGQEVPVVDCSAITSTATGSFTLNTAQTQLTYSIVSTGIDFSRLLGGAPFPANTDPNDIRVMHFHSGAFGAGGPVVFDLVRLNGTSADLERTVTLINGATFQYLITGSVDSAEPFLAGATFSSFIQDLNAGNIYLNIHSTRLPGGEVRGQLGLINPVPEPTTMVGMVGLGLWAALRKKKQAN